MCNYFLNCTLICLVIAHLLTDSGARWTNQIARMIIATSTSPATARSERVLEWRIAELATIIYDCHGVVEIDREGFVEVIELDPSSFACIYASALLSECS